MNLLKYFSKELVDEFIEVYSRRPYRHNKWGCKFMNSFFLYCYARTIKPTLIIELGTYQGQTTWLLEQACRARIYSFDITHWKLKKKTKKAYYIKSDWNDFWKHTELKGMNPMIYIDDHINQMQRLSEATERGFKHIFFDDNIPLDKIDSQLNVPLPTLSCYGIGEVLPTDTYLTYVTEEQRSSKWVWRD